MQDSETLCIVASLYHATYPRHQSPISITLGPLVGRRFSPSSANQDSTFAAGPWLQQAMRDGDKQQTPTTTSKSHNNGMYELQTHQTQGTLMRNLPLALSSLDSNSARRRHSAMGRSRAVALVPIRDTSVNISWAKTNASKSTEILMMDRALGYVLILIWCSQVLAPKGHRRVLEACHPA